MRLRWPWRHEHKPHQVDGNGHEAANARADAERKLRDAQRQWPEVFRARDELARLAERAMRGTR
jgi:hypothetical protein